MNDLSSSLISWLKLTGKITEIDGAFQEFNDYYPLIEAFHELFPEIVFDQDDEASSFFSYMVDNRPNSFIPECDYDINNFLNCDFELFEDIVKQFLWMMKERKPEELKDQLNKLHKLQQENLLRFLKSSNPSHEMQDKVQRIRDYCRVLDTKIQLISVKEDCKAKYLDLESQSSSRAGELNREKSSEVTTQHQKLIEIKEKNKNLKNELKNLQNDYENQLKDYKKEEDKYVSEINSLLSLKNEMKAKIEQLSFLDDNVNEFNLQYMALERELSSSSEQLKVITSQRDLLAQDFEAERLRVSQENFNIQKTIEEKDRQIKDASQRLENLQNQINKNREQMREELYNGDTSVLLKTLNAERQRRQENLQKLEKLRDESISEFGNLSS